MVSDQDIARLAPETRGIIILASGEDWRFEQDIHLIHGEGLDRLLLRLLEEHVGRRIGRQVAVVRQPGAERAEAG